MADSLTDVAELINFDYTEESRAEFWPIDDTEWMVRFANIEESTNVLIVAEI